MNKFKMKLTAIISIGTLLEWAEYTFYGYMAIKLAHIFFPNQEPYLATMKTFGIFAVGYIMRPLGALVFGLIGDKHGRKPALLYSMVLMGIATFLIGCLPGYETWGMMAPAALLILRMVQGIAVSGEYNGAGIFIVEKDQDNLPCYAGSWVSSSAALGMVVGGLAAFIVSLPNMPEWAWRVPFWAGGLSCLLGLYLRKSLTESEEFQDNSHSLSSKQHPIISILKNHKASFLYVAAMAAITGVYVYIMNIYAVAFLKQYVHLPTHHASFFAMFGEFLVFIFIPIMGLVADHGNPQKQYNKGLILIAVSSPLIFALLLSGNYFYITIAMIVYAFLNGMVCGPMIKLMVDRFPPEIRYTGISVAWSVSAAIFAGTAPMMAHYLTSQMRWLIGPGFYVSLTAIVALVVINLTTRKTGTLTIKTKPVAYCENEMHIGKS